MPVNFFNEECKTVSTNREFGLCDDNLRPYAYIKEDGQNSWEGIVINENNYQINFYPIDNCIDLRRADGKMSKRCDGLLNFNQNLIFVELKSRKWRGSKWLNDGIEQLRSTIHSFTKSYNLADYPIIRAYVCNQFKPQANQGHAVKLEKFKNETGIILRAQQEIVV
ncbi:hypothetical protein ACE01N_18215 [Saccharicrinis sp. FJH2]|uniref:hypothetical protein n=1 Tax=Saccharicrinis sp. FJH65 TaxID=3344659 RepID=UPI0035F3D5F4